MSEKDHMPEILIVDDVAENIDVLGEVLKPHYKRKAALSGEKALQIAASGRPPDLILLDVMMPQMSGPEIAAQLKNCEETKKIPIIFLTGVLDEEEADTHKHVIGGEYFLGKPVKIEELLYMINRLIG